AAAAAMAAAQAMGATAVLNPAPTPSTALPADLLADCDLVVPNEHEAALLGGPAALLAAGVGAVIVTRGAAGVTLVSPTGSVDVPAYTVAPVDTTAAGDAFCGALCARLADGDDLDEALRFAMAAGALATTQAG